MCCCPSFDSCLFVRVCSLSRLIFRTWTASRMLTNVSSEISDSGTSGPGRKKYEKILKRWCISRGHKGFAIEKMIRSMFDCSHKKCFTWTFRKKCPNSDTRNFPSFAPSQGLSHRQIFWRWLHKCSSRGVKFNMAPNGERFPTSCQNFDAASSVWKTILGLFTLVTRGWAASEDARLGGLRRLAVGRPQKTRGWAASEDARLGSLRIFDAGIKIQHDAQWSVLMRASIFWRARHQRENPYWIACLRLSTT